MKKVITLVVCCLMVTGIVFAGDDNHNRISVQDTGKIVTIKIENVHFTPVDEDVTQKEWVVPEKVILYSGILDSANIKEALAEVKVANGGIEFKFLNAAKVSDVPVVEHIWGFSPDRKMALILDPADSWVCYKIKADGKPDLNTLAIGLVMYPDKPTEPLKPFGKLPQGKHPEIK